MGKKGKSGNNAKKQAQKEAKNRNAQNVTSLNRLAKALTELGATVVTTNSSSSSLTRRNEELSDFKGLRIKSTALPLPLNHWKELPDNVTHAYKMLSDGAELIKATSTKYTLLGKINLEDGSKYADELRQGCELVATSALLIHQVEYGCSRSTRKFIKQSTRAIVARVISLVESFMSLSALESNVGAQNTGAVWDVCDEAISKMPKGNRASMRRELFTWVRECNETMEEFQELVDLGVTSEPKEEEDGDDDEGDWDDFCENKGQYDSNEIPIVRSILALIKCSRGTLGLVLKAMEAAGIEAEKTQDDTTRSSIFQWMSNLHETSRIAGEDVTDLGMLLYPPMSFDSGHVGDKTDDKTLWEHSEIGRKVILQRDCLSGIIKNIQASSSEKEGDILIPYSEDILELASKLSSAVATRANEAVTAIQSIPSMEAQMLKD